MEKSQLSQNDPKIKNRIEFRYPAMKSTIDSATDYAHKLRKEKRNFDIDKRREKAMSEIGTRDVKQEEKENQLIIDFLTRHSELINSNSDELSNVYSSKNH